MKRVLERLDASRRKLRQTLSPIAADVYSRRPAENEWSVAEIVQHLELVEGRVLKELETAVAQPPRRVGTLRRLIPTSIVASRLIRVTAPKAVTPTDPPSKEVGIENLERTRTRLQDFCSTHGNQRLRSLVFKHPFLGEIDGVATISFVGYHERRHCKQIQEVLRRLVANSPG